MVEALSQKLDARLGVVLVVEFTTKFTKLLCECFQPARSLGLPAGDHGLKLTIHIDAARGPL